MITRVTPLTGITDESGNSNRIHRIYGLRQGNEVYLSTSSPLAFFDRYWHETGHVIGDQLSFQKDQVLSPDAILALDALNIEHAVGFNRIDTLELFKLIVEQNRPTVGISGRLKPVADKILSIYTRSNFDVSTIILHSDTSLERIEEIVKGDQVSTTEKNAGGELVAISSREGRNIEIPAYATESGCIIILEKLLSLIERYVVIEMIDPDAPSHSRALRLVTRSYGRPDMRLPSGKDFLDKKTT